jgi:hypothetical protein
MDSLINIGLIVAYIMLFAAVAALVIIPLVSLFKGNTKNPKGVLLSIAVLAGILILAYIISPAEQGDFYTKMNTSARASKLIGAGLLSTYFIAAAFVLITLYTIVAKWFR